MGGTQCIHLVVTLKELGTQLDLPRTTSHTTRGDAIVSNLDTRSRAAAARPFFLKIRGREIFLLYHPPAQCAVPVRQLLFVPPFAEEMHKARRMAALQARRLAQRGIGVLLMDLYGTGESQGDFGEARWQTWQDDVHAALDWLEGEQSGTIALWGLRLGALLALDALQQRSRGVERIVLWQPVVSGELLIKQVLMLRTSHSVMKGQPETLQQLRARLTEGRRIEVAGYELALELVTAIERVNLTACPPPPGVPVHWLEVTLEQAQRPPLASQRVIEAWRSLGRQVTTCSVVGNAFWTGKEITVVPAMLEETERIFAKDEYCGP